jgi:hypothetical protein
MIDIADRPYRCFVFPSSHAMRRHIWKQCHGLNLPWGVWRPRHRHRPGAQPQRRILRPGGQPPRTFRRLLSAGKPRSACRTLARAARFVGGYERNASLQENGDLHAWAAVYLAGAGRRGYDPSRALPVTASYVAAAAASDPLLASPVTGAYRGSASAKMEFSISMQVE